MLFKVVVLLLLGGMYYPYLEPLLVGLATPEALEPLHATETGTVITSVDVVPTMEDDFKPEPFPWDVVLCIWVLVLGLGVVVLPVD
jgi:hypothetical protein